MPLLQQFYLRDNHLNVQTIVFFNKNHSEFSDDFIFDFCEIFNTYIKKIQYAYTGTFMLIKK